ncbi:MAG: helix-turn-helix transcriptional regulator [Acidobacteria bacterium]|nr:helix-turn-helix transcriptional regulator [Acidobacteriota bacterium]
MDVLILKALSLKHLHGYGVLLWISKALGGAIVEVPQGSVYPALYRLENLGLILSEWGKSDSGHEAKYYRLTRAGRRALQHQTAIWEEYAAAMALALRGGSDNPD